jgi:hypothetical protein
VTHLSQVAVRGKHLVGDVTVTLGRFGHQLPTSHLIDPVNRKWKFDVLKNLVDPCSLSAILQVIVPARAQQDRLIWTLTPSGRFTVKTAITQCLSLGNVIPQTNSIWKLLWNMKMHKRLKVFMWRLGSNTLPTKQLLFHKTGFGDPMCPLCGSNKESYQHLFLKCSVIRPIWFGLNWGLHPDSLPIDSSLDLLNLVINPPICPGIDLNPKTLKAQTSIQIALTLENIWSVRNQRVHNNTKVNHLSIVKNLEGRILEHFHIIDPGILADSLSISPLCWSAPPSNVVKLNTDAALKDGKATLAVVARDDTGTIINC